MTDLESEHSKRIRAAVVVAPVIDTTGNPERRQPILDLAMRDRAARLTENEPPFYLPYANEDGSVPNGFQLPPDMIPALHRLGIPVENRVYVQTYYVGLSWNILNLVKFISPTPIMMVTPELDMSVPTEDQLACFGKLEEPKQLDILKGKGHLDWMFGDVESVLKRQLEFLRKHGAV